MGIGHFSTNVFNKTGDMRFTFMCCLLLSMRSVSAQDTLDVFYSDDFAVDGKGSASSWDKTQWVSLTQLDGGAAGYDTRFKLLYSQKGIYVLFHGLDRKITSTYFRDFDDMYNADVFEVFFHPNPLQPVYFEYEINPHDKELVLLIPNLEGRFYGWQPWHYEGERKVQHKVYIEEGNSGMRSWSAECFFPYGLLNPMEQVPAVKGIVWNANFCRLDYDSGSMVKWSWSPIKHSFHEYKKYRSIRFR